MNGPQGCWNWLTTRLVDECRGLKTFLPVFSIRLITRSLLLSSYVVDHLNQVEVRTLTRDSLLALDSMVR